MSAIWTGDELIIWGGLLNSLPTASGARYSPTTDTWTPISMTGAPSARISHSAVWTGTEMIIWGGLDDSNFNPPRANTGARYDPVQDTWTPTSTINAPTGRELHPALWLGSRMIIWGGRQDNGVRLDSGAFYDPISDSWAPTSTVNAPAPREEHSMLWTGSLIAVWGGFSDALPGGTDTGGLYDPVLDAWTATATTSAPARRLGHSAAFNATTMIIWGGYSPTGLASSGGCLDLANNTWLPTPVSNERFLHTTVWAGTEMIVWGGRDASGALVPGGAIFTP